MRNPASEGGVTSTVAHTDQVCGSFGGGDQRLEEIMRAAVRHLHAFAEDVKLTREEWMEGIQFLTAVGDRCDEVRQEYILLSDTLGLSMLLEMINNVSDLGASDSTVLGPFFVPGAPDCDNGGSVVADAKTGGTPLTVRGRVLDTSGVPVPGATIDFWQVQPNGRYDIEDDPGKRNLRGTMRTGADGGFCFTTVRPVNYTIPADGPVGAMLRATGRHVWRPAHVHFRITADGFEPLVTHLFDRNSPYLESDTVFAVRPSLITDMDGPECAFDFVLSGEPSS